jgi:hypothetical protein
MVLLFWHVPLWATTIEMTGQLTIVSLFPPSGVLSQQSADVVSTDSASIGLSYNQNGVQALVIGSANPYSGSIIVSNYSDSGQDSSVEATLLLSGWYVFTGGQGSTSVDTTAWFTPISGGGSSQTCGLVLNGVGLGCESSPVGPFQADFNVPYWLSLSASFSVGASLGDAQSGGIEYNFTSGLPSGVEITAVPEPASALLLLTGIPIALFRRARKRTFTRSAASRP